MMPEVEKVQPGHGPESPADVAAMLDEVDQKVKSESDPEWFAKYGQNLADYTRSLFE